MVLGTSLPVLVRWVNRACRHA